MKWSFVLIAGLLAGMASAETNEVSRYQVIVDRAPFGQVTPAGAAVAQPGFSTRFQFVGLVYSNSIPLAIINDAQGNRPYFRFAGEMIDDVKVVRINTNKPQQVVLQQGLVQATLGYEERKGGTASATPISPQPPHLFAPTEPGGAPPRRIPFQRGRQ